MEYMGGMVGVEKLGNDKYLAIIRREYLFIEQIVNECLLRVRCCVRS